MVITAGELLVLAIVPLLEPPVAEATHVAPCTVSVTPEALQKLWANWRAAD
jgi:hypothetical protein